MYPDRIEPRAHICSAWTWQKPNTGRYVKQANGLFPSLNQTQYSLRIHVIPIPVVGSDADVDVEEAGENVDVDDQIVADVTTTDG